MSQHQISQLKPETAKVFDRALSLHRSGELLQAKSLYEQVLLVHPQYFDALHLLGVLCLQTHDLTSARNLIVQAIEIRPNFAPAFTNLGVVMKGLKQLDEALACYEKAIALKPDHADAFSNRGIVLLELKRFDEALASYNTAIAIKPKDAIAYYNRGVTLHALHRLEDALASYEKAIEFNGNYVEALYNRGNVFKELHRYEDALLSYDKAISLKPDYADAWLNRGIVLQVIKRPEDALKSYDQAIANNSDCAEAFSNRGIALHELKRFEEALASYDMALAINPHFADAFYNSGIALQELNRLEEALKSYEKASSIHPHYDYLPGAKFHLQMKLCDWTDWHHQLEQIEAAVLLDKKATHPFTLLGLKDDPTLHLKASTIFVNENNSATNRLGPMTCRSANGKIRIGYYSADFHNHATSYLIAELFEKHDKQKFEIFGFSLGPQIQDEMRNRIVHCMHHFFDITRMSDRQVAQFSRDLGIDIAIDLKGFTQDARFGIFAEKCAPLQVNYLGYPGSLGASYFDYIVADRTLIPCDSQKHYLEKIIYLPGSYQVNDANRKISNQHFSRQELGLPESGFVFCCFNNNYKILPATFDIWMRLLKGVEESVLWLFEANPIAANNLRKEAQKRGVDPTRLVFAPRMKLEDHLDRHQAADLFIDTFPYNAHTTASDALWSGLPVLTQMGQSFSARVAASLLVALDLPELIAQNPKDYEAKAIDFANNPVKLENIKKKLAQNKKTSPLFSGEIFARNIEAAYTEIYRRHLAGAQTDHIEVQASTTPFKPLGSEL